MTYRPNRRHVRGVSIVEFVIVFPLAALFVLGLIQAGFVYMAKTTLNHASFMAAREGSIHNANQTIIREAMVRGLIPFYQDNTELNATKRLGKAYASAKLDAVRSLDIIPVSPTAEAFEDFAVNDPNTMFAYIPNDHLEWRDLKPGPKSKLNIRDANLLKIRVIYGYELKVPLIAGVVKRLMCGGTTGVDTWGNVSKLESVYGLTRPVLCLRYFQNNRMPIETTAIVEMQSPAYQ